MKSVLDENVLVLNKNWQAIAVRSVRDAIGQLAIGAATAILIDEMRPVKWDEWITLPVNESDGWIQTSKTKIRRPTVIACVNYAKISKRRPKFGLRGVTARDGNRCQYTGRYLKPEERTQDHVIPRSRGGTNTWENVALCHKDINHAKGNRTPEEAGLKLLKQPKAPLELLPIHFLSPSHPDHEHFLKID